VNNTNYFSVNVCCSSSFFRVKTGSTHHLAEAARITSATKTSPLLAGKVNFEKKLPDFIASLQERRKLNHL